MLVLTRRVNEQIQIGDQVSLSVVAIEGNKVRIGIDAPSNIKIIRGELLADRRKANANASPRILIVDDSADDRQLVRRYMMTSAKHRFNFMETDLGEHGLELCRQQSPDCVLLDYHLPDLNGLEFLDELRRQATGRTIPVILFTGQGNEKVAVTAMKNGAKDYLVKQDLSPQSLQRAVYDAIHLPFSN